jgi:hypothetical protein
MARTWGRYLRRTAVVTLLLVGGYAVLMMPTTTRQGVDYRVNAYTIPVYVKAVDFVQRHNQYGLLVSRICGQKASAVDCTMAIFDWTHANIRPTPAGWPVIDDHPLNIVIRGHGTSDQMADVFVTLTDYAGVPAFLTFVTEPTKGETLVLSFARLDGKWRVFDAANHVVFRRRDGAIAEVEDLVDDPALVDAQARAAPSTELPYSAFISRQRLMPFVVPHPLRAEMQRPWPRVRYELRRTLGLERE